MKNNPLRKKPNPNKKETNKKYIRVDAWDVLKRRA